jgi:hypothetical protein
MKIFFLVFNILLSVLTAWSQNPSRLIFSEGLAPQKALNGKKELYGFVNTKGNFRVSPQFDTVYAPFKNGLAVVGLNGRAGVINKKGNVILPFEYIQIGEISKFAIAVKSDRGNWGFFNHKGEKIYDFVFQNFRYSGRNKIIVQQNGKWGVINDRGNILIDFNFKWVQQVSEKYYRVWSIPVWTVRTADNQILFSSSWDSLKYLEAGRYAYSIIGKKGLLDEQGKVISDAVYYEIDDFRWGLSKAKKEKYGVIDVNNKPVLHFFFDEVIIDSLYIRVMMKVKENGKEVERWGLYDHKGKELIKPKYAWLSQYSDGLISAKKDDNSWGYIDPSGNTIILFRYSQAGDFQKGRAEVVVSYFSIQKELPAIIDNKGEFIISPADYEFYKLGLITISSDNKIFYHIPRDKYFHYERIDKNYIRVGKNGYWGMILTDGKEIIPPIYEKVSDPSDTGLIIVEKGGKRGVIDSKGVFTMKMNARFENIYGFHEGFSKFLLKSRYGFIDKHGDIYISAQYPDAGDMSDSMVSVILKGKWGFLDYKENLKVQPYYEEVTLFKKGIAMVKENGLWNFINKEGKEFYVTGFEKIEKVFSGRYLLYNQGKMGMADQNGREILAPKYDYLIETGYGYVLAKRNNYWGVLDYNENFVLPIEFDGINYEPSAKIFITVSEKKQIDFHIK